jgi:hypothetical protein
MVKEKKRKQEKEKKIEKRKNSYGGSKVFFWDYTVQRRRSQHARTLAPMNTCTQTLPLWAPPKDWAPADLEIPEVTNGASSSTGTSLTT